MSTRSDRFATRFGPIKVDCPTSEEISEFLARGWRLPRKAAEFIALGCCGNVRDALLRAANYLIVGEIVERPKRAPSFEARQFVSQRGNTVNPSDNRY